MKRSKTLVEFVTLRVPGPLMDRLDRAIHHYKTVAGEDATRSSMTRDILEYGLDVIEERFGLKVDDKESTCP
jgi:hypothetical protein